MTIWTGLANWPCLVGYFSLIMTNLVISRQILFQLLFWEKEQRKLAVTVERVWPALAGPFLETTAREASITSTAGVNKQKNM